MSRPTALGRSMAVAAGVLAVLVASAFPVGATRGDPVQRHRTVSAALATSAGRTPQLLAAAERPSRTVRAVARAIAGQYRVGSVRTATSSAHGLGAALAPATQPTIEAPTDGATVAGQVAVSVVSTAPFVVLTFGPKDATVGVGAGGNASHSFDSSGMAGLTTVSAADCDDAAGTDCGVPATATVTVANAPPTLTKPARGARVRLSLGLAAETTATAVSFRIDGEQAAFDDTSPFATTVSTDALGLGAHEVDAVNCDATGLCDEANPAASRTFTVLNRLRPTIARIAPSPFNPDGPARVSSTTVRYRVDADSTVGLRVRDSRGKTVFGPVSLGVRHPSAVYAYRWAGRGTGGARLASGRYAVELETESTDNANLVGHAAKSVTIDARPARVRGGGSSPRTFFPARDRFKDTATFRGRLSEPVASLKVEVRSPRGKVVRTINAGHRPAGAFHVVWNGRTGGGAIVDAGRYSYRYLTRNRLGNVGRSKAFNVRVSAKRLVRQSWSATVSAHQSFITNISGRCSGVYTPSNRGWEGSLGYYSDYRCAGIDDEAVAAAVHGVRVPRAMRYGSIRVDAYGACSLPEIHDRAAIIYIDSSGDLSDVGFLLSWRVGWHRGRSVSADGVVSRGGQLRWVTGTIDVDWYDVQDYKVSLVYFELR
jgi:FlgD Ig-like domain